MLFNRNFSDSIGSLFHPVDRVVLFKIFLILVCCPVLPAVIHAGKPASKSSLPPGATNPVLSRTSGNAGDPLIIEKDNTFYLFYTTSGIKGNLEYVTSKDMVHWSGPKIALRPTPGTWDEPYIGQASIRLVDGIYYMAYTGGPNGKAAALIGTARSKDLVHWEKDSHNPILRDVKGTWEDHDIDSPNLVYSDKTWYVYYEAINDGIGAEKKEYLGVTISKDFINWKQYEKNPVLPNRALQAIRPAPKDRKDAEVLRYGDGWLMYFFNRKDKEIHIATSDNLLDWKETETVVLKADQVWEDGRVQTPSVLKLGDMYYMFYNGSNFKNIGLATSKNLYGPWTKLPPGSDSK